MLDTLERLSRLMPPPLSPVAASGDWPLIEKQIGTRLPSDYISFIGRYGRGAIADFFYVLNPFDPNPFVNFMSQYPLILDGERELRSQFPESFTEPLFPEPGGILPCAITDNGDQVFWRTGSEPDSWTIAVLASRGDHYADYPFSITEFLLAWLSHDLIVTQFPNDEEWIPVFRSRPLAVNDSK